MIGASQTFINIEALIVSVKDLYHNLEVFF